VKWNKPDGGVQHSTDGRYGIVRAAETGPIWIAYALGPTAGQQLGTTNDDGLAREICEGHERGRKCA
jgi:hypothetical protein